MSRYTEDDDAPKPTQSAPEIKNEPVVVNGANEIKSQPPEAAEPTFKEENTYSGDQNDDDEIDINLGGGNDYSGPPAQQEHGPGIKEDG
jgi:hypothetical protein